MKVYVVYSTGIYGGKPQVNIYGVYISKEQANAIYREVRAEQGKTKWSDWDAVVVEEQDLQ